MLDAEHSRPRLADACAVTTLMCFTPSTSRRFRLIQDPSGAPDLPCLGARLELLTLMGARLQQKTEAAKGKPFSLEAKRELYTALPA